MPLSKSFDVSNIFISWSHLIDAHESRLLERMEKSNVMDKGVVLSLFLNSLKSSTDLYVKFCSRQKESMKNFETKLMSDIRFRQLVKECQRKLHKLIAESHSESLSNSQTASSSISNWFERTLSNAKLPLTNFIIKPMQRITKYSLIFTKILEILNKQLLSDERQLIGLASEVKSEALKLCEQVNEACREKEDTEQNKRKLAWAQSHIKQSMNHESSLDLISTVGIDDQQAPEGKPVETIIFDSETNLLGPRQLLKAGCLSKLRSGRELILFLFNDILLMTQVRGGSVLKVEDIFRSTKAQQTYYKFYRAPILLENLTLSSVSRNRRSSWVEKQSITVSFSDQLTGILYELLAMSKAEKDSWTQELGRASDEARKARSIQYDRSSLVRSPRMERAY